MQAVSLWVPRDEFIRALSALGTARRKRFTSVLPVWLRHDKRERMLWIEEQAARVSGAIAAEGSWPAMGATIDLLSGDVENWTSLAVARIARRNRHVHRDL
jgi:hypothetical protein